MLGIDTLFTGICKTGELPSEAKPLQINLDSNMYYYVCLVLENAAVPPTVAKFLVYISPNVPLVKHLIGESYEWKISSFDPDSAVVSVGPSLAAAPYQNVLPLNSGAMELCQIVCALFQEQGFSRSTLTSFRASSPLFALSLSTFSANSCRVYFNIPGQWFLSSSESDAGTLLSVPSGPMRSLVASDEDGMIKIVSMPSFSASSSETEIAKLILESSQNPVAIIASPPLGKLSLPQLAAGTSMLQYYLRNG